MNHLNISPISISLMQSTINLSPKLRKDGRKCLGNARGENRKIEPGSFLADSPTKNKPSITDEKTQELFNTIDSLSENERKYFFRQPDMRYDHSNLDINENPVTSIKGIKDLQTTLAQILIEFVTDRNLADIDEIHFISMVFRIRSRRMNGSPQVTHQYQS